MSNLIVVVPDGQATALSQRMTDEQLMALALTILDKDKASSSPVLQAVRIFAELGRGKLPRKNVPLDQGLITKLMRGILEDPRTIANSLGFQILETSQVLERGYTFANGSRPDVWKAYRAHPYTANYLIPFAFYHDFMVNDKRAEFLAIASSLGAKSVEIVESKSRRNGGGVGVKVDAPTGESIGGKAGYAEGEKDTFSLAFRNDSKPVHLPRLPESTRWLAGEPLWLTMTQTRLQQWSTQLTVSFEYRGSFESDAELAAGLEGMGISVGGRYQTQNGIDRTYVVEFWPREDYGSLL